MNFFKNGLVFGQLVQHWKILLVVSMITLFVSILISSPLIIEASYKSEFTVYPTNLIPFGKEASVDQLFQFFKSEDLKISLKKRFNLLEHFSIDSTKKISDKEFNKIYNSNITVNFTRYQSLEISVIDASPKFAQKLANGMIEEANNLIRKRKKEKYNEFIDVFSKQLNAKKKEIDSIENKLKFMRMNYGLLDITSQSKILNKKLSKKELNEVDKILLQSLKEFGGEFTILQNRFTVELENYKSLKQAYDKNVTDFNAHLTYITVISSPNLPDKKYSPNRFLIVTLMTFSSLILASVIILFRKEILIKSFK